MQKTQKNQTRPLHQEILSCLSMVLWVHGIHLVSAPILFFLYIQIFEKQNYIWILIMILQQIYQFKFAKKQEWFVKLGLIQQTQQYFDKWEVIEEEKIPEQKALIGCHPHGIASFATTLVDTTQKINAVLMSRVILAFPVSGMFLRWAGFQSVDSQNLLKNLKNNKTFSMLPGGFEEATLSCCTQNRVFLKERKGFIKYALQYGYKIIPCFNFGENQTYSVFQPLLKFRLWLNKFKVPGTFFLSKYGLVPRKNVNIRTVIGKGIQLPQIQLPTKEQVEKYHKMYMEQLMDLYERHRKIIGEKSKLEIY